MELMSNKIREQRLMDNGRREYVHFGDERFVQKEVHLSETTHRYDTNLKTSRKEGEREREREKRESGDLKPLQSNSVQSPVTLHYLSI